MASEQLVLDLLASYPASFDNFVTGQNAELVAHLQQLARGTLSPASLYLWGETGSGKTHLAGSTARLSLSLGRKVTEHHQHSLSEWVAADPHTGQSDLHLVENVEQLGASALHGLFGLLNELRSHSGGALLATGLAPPAALPVRDDVASRLSWGLVTRCIALDEHDRGVALQRLATERGVSLSPDLVPYLLTHTARDMRALTGLFDRLDRFALARNRALTLPLLREYLQTSLRASGADF